MLQFLADYGASIMVAVIVALVIFLAVRSMLKNKKNGKGSCSCGGSCASCGCCSQCHPTSDKK